jgi:hypothetical protein
MAGSSRGWKSLAVQAIALSLCGCGATQYAQPASELHLAPVQPPVQLTAEQDHQRLMDALHIKSLRPGVDGWNPKASNAVNYDEAKAGPFGALPDPLAYKRGGRVMSASGWDERRREILEDFDREVYGRTPANLPAVRWEVISTQTITGDTPTVTKELVGHVDNSADPAIHVDIGLKVVLPTNAKGPVPVIMEFGFQLPPGLKLPPPPPGPAWQEQVLALGWGYAILQTTSVQADNGDGLTSGIIGLVNRGQPRKVDDWGALKAWAWGASRALDYLGTEPAVDAKHVAIEGLSRFGKAALITMAYDQRFAIGFIGSSGEGGAKLSRRNYGELVENVASSGEYHWMAGNFLKYAGPLAAKDLPVDAHELIALCAPRPVLIGAGTREEGDGWVDPKGMFLAAVAAGPVYKLLGKKDLGTSAMPPPGTPLVAGDLAFSQHTDGHSNVPNWPVFLKFAQREFSPAPALPAPKPPASNGVTGATQKALPPSPVVPTPKPPPPNTTVSYSAPVVPIPKPPVPRQ